VPILRGCRSGPVRRRRAWWWRPGLMRSVLAGDDVITFRVPGAYAAELVAPAQALVPKPPALDLAQTAGLMLTDVTAWHALTATGVDEGTRS